MSRAGGLSRIRLHGNPGTPEGRRLGGLSSQKRQKLSGTRFKILRLFPTPANSTELAELLGILAGDGHLGRYQISVTTNSGTDLEHALFVKGLFERLFFTKASLSFRKDSKACVVTVSSKHISDILVKKGMVQGHKINGSLKMPVWVCKNKKYQKSFVRGLFDTDGSVYLDTHTTKNKTYKNIAMIFTNRCLPLLNDFKQVLTSNNMHPTQKTDFAVFLRRKEDIRKYFEVIGSSNPKHVRKVEAYFSSQK